MRRNIVEGKILIQPAIDFKYEVALYAPNKDKRWELVKYDYTSEDYDFAKRFIKWNNIKNGIQRVDACRTYDDQLLLVELEDLNPYLSILETDEDTRKVFIKDLINALNNMM